MGISIIVYRPLSPEVNIPQEELLEKLPYATQELLGYFEARCAAEQEKLANELGQAIQRQQKQWTSVAELFDVSQFPYHEEKLLKLCHSMDLLLAGTLPADSALQNLWSSCPNERKRLRNRIFKYSQTLQANVDEREYLIKYNMEIGVLLRRASEVHARENLIHRLDISKESFLKSPLCTQKRVKKATLSVVDKDAYVLKERLFPTNIQIQLGGEKNVTIYSTTAELLPSPPPNSVLTLKEETYFEGVQHFLEEAQLKQQLSYGWLDPTFAYDFSRKKLFHNFQRLVYNEKEAGYAIVFEKCPSEFHRKFILPHINYKEIDLSRFICVFLRINENLGTLRATD